MLFSQYENYSVELTLLPLTYETVRDEAVVMDQEEDIADVAESKPASESTEAPKTEPPIEETEYTEPVETTVPEDTDPEITEPTEVTAATESILEMEATEPVLKLPFRRKPNPRSQSQLILYRKPQFLQRRSLRPPF